MNSHLLKSASFIVVMVVLMNGCRSAMTDKQAAISSSMWRIQIKHPAGPPPPIDFAVQAHLPAYATKLSGDNRVRFNNRNDFPVLVAIRSGDKGMDIRIPAGGIRGVSLPNGEFGTYIVFSVQPGSACLGDHFQLPAKDALEIQVPDVATR